MNDADFEMAELQQMADTESRLQKQGICCHGHRQGYNPVHAPFLKKGQEKCLECGKIAMGHTLDEERKRNLNL